MKEDQVLKQLAKYSFFIMLLLICFVAALSYREKQKPSEEELEVERLAQIGMDEVGFTPLPTATPVAEVIAQSGNAEEEEVWALWQFIQHSSMEELEAEFGERCILIRKPAGSSTLTVTEDLIKHSMTLRLTCEEEYLQAAGVLRFFGDNYFYGALAEGEFMTEYGILAFEEEEACVSEIVLVTDGYFVPEIKEKEEYYVVNFLPYKDVYQKIVVLDAGHGGKDPGTGADGWRIKESDINLKMLLMVKEYLEQNSDIKVICTRTTDVALGLAERADLALGVEADLFLSFHCNAAESKWRNGTEVLYNKEQGTEDAFNSREFAKLCLDKLTDALGTVGNGVINRQDLHIVRRATMPMALLELAYMSNATDLKVLKNEEKLQAAAVGVAEAVLEAYERME